MQIGRSQSTQNIVEQQVGVCGAHLDLAIQRRRVGLHVGLHVRDAVERVRLGLLAAPVSVTVQLAEPAVAGGAALLGCF
ncbi:hypothetical protein [Dyella sp.]|uniref:hypothetical protein n=1 Tax=Dyella sp. TaxID=1869338 RepID=UPI002844BA4B|nr:hypothetical protein [Dyella sp.]MDR3444322.1 hypothetical protein [Dyella sp.]